MTAIHSDMDAMYKNLALNLVWATESDALAADKFLGKGQKKTGACIQLHTDGDVAGSLMAVNPDADVDVMMGSGGTPEGVISACAIRAVGGQLLARLDPQSEQERRAIESYGTDLNQLLTAQLLIKSSDAFFAATGISGGSFLPGVKYNSRGAVSHSVILNGQTGTVRFIKSFHYRR